MNIEKEIDVLSEELKTIEEGLQRIIKQLKELNQWHVTVEEETIVNQQEEENHLNEEANLSEKFL